MGLVFDTGSFKSASSFKTDGSYKEFLKNEKIEVKKEEPAKKKKKVLLKNVDPEILKTEEKTRSQLQDFVMSVSKKDKEAEKKLQIMPRKSNNPL